MTARSWSELQLDALRELGNVGGGRAATALSRLLVGRQVLSELPRSVALGPSVPAAFLGSAAGPWWVARFEVSGAVTGDLLWAIPATAAGDLLERLLPSGAARGGGASLSALSEAANIMGSAYLDGAASLTGLSLVPSPPRVERQTGEELEAAWWRGRGTDPGRVAISTGFREASSQTVRGLLVLIPSVPGTTVILAAMRLSA